ncbi:MAG: hypothetical protein AMS27_09525 [Bacteroides sp. SM23_62_1]|nr:MAG: hypothetical protein AMS27_09525 [Bacteroides sp. SM23_62_1]
MVGLHWSQGRIGNKGNRVIWGLKYTIFINIRSLFIGFSIHIKQAVTIVTLTTAKYATFRTIPDIITFKDLKRFLKPSGTACKSTQLALTLMMRDVCFYYLCTFKTCEVKLYNWLTIFSEFFYNE